MKKMICGLALLAFVQLSFGMDSKKTQTVWVHGEDIPVHFQGHGQNFEIRCAINKEDALHGIDHFYVFGGDLRELEHVILYPGEINKSFSQNNSSELNETSLNSTYMKNFAPKLWALYFEARKKTIASLLNPLEDLDGKKVVNITHLETFLNNSVVVATCPRLVYNRYEDYEGNGDFFDLNSEIGW